MQYWVLLISFLMMLASLWMRTDPDDYRIGEAAIVHVLNNSNPDLVTDSYIRTTVNFTSHGDTMDAWLYKSIHDSPSIREKDSSSTHHASSKDSSSPQEFSQSSSCILMAHGLGSQRDQGLHKYAEVFVATNRTVVVFDYRNFGGSGGMPRNLVLPERHVEDWIEAIRWLGGRDSPVLCSSISLWGSSFSGGHVLFAAAALSKNSSTTPPIKAIISQVPHLNGMAASIDSIKKRGYLATARLATLGIIDQTRSLLFPELPALYVRLIDDEESGRVAFMLVSKQELDIYYSKHPKSLLGGWKPWVPARLVLFLSRYSPAQALPMIKSPVLFISASKDTLCSPEVIQKAALACKGLCEVMELEADHFSVYRGKFFKTATNKMTEFLDKHLQLRNGSIHL